MAEADTDQQRILQGFEDVAKAKEQTINAQTEVANLRPKRWDEALAKQKPAIDYSDIFDVDVVGQEPGLEVWEIENFLPNPLDAAFHGNFYEEDCYIILQTALKEDGSKEWSIWYWIGERTTLDKKACSAIHAVNLRNLLGASCRTVREEMNEESEEFMDVFGGELCYVEGGRTSSGFFTVEPTVFAKRLYRIHPRGQQIHLEPVAPRLESLDPRFVFLLDAGTSGVRVVRAEVAGSAAVQDAAMVGEAEQDGAEGRRGGGVGAAGLGDAGVLGAAVRATVASAGADSGARAVRVELANGEGVRGVSGYGISGAAAARDPLAASCDSPCCRRRRCTSWTRTRTSSSGWERSPHGC